MNDAAWLRVEAIRAGYPGPGGMRVVVDGVSLELPEGGIGCLLGASGCGKTTVLRAIAGLEPLLAGRIVLQGRTLADAGGGLPAERRGVGLMFQDYALFPHLDVAGNVGFGLASQPRDARRARVAEMLGLVGLSEAARAYPHELSGGQQQRIALARALAPAPSLLLLDEPFSSLDTDTRQHLAGELRALLKRAGITALLVTHDQAEAFAIADRIGVMAQGRILQWADAGTLYHRPANRDVAGFVGRGALLPAAALGLPGGGEVLLRPGQLQLAADGSIDAVFEGARFLGPGHVARLRLPGGETVEVDVPAQALPEPGRTVRLRLADGARPVVFGA